ncbi:hypothetical protein An11g08380 [Aspergillus niger]|uniref:Uncharacterized protein n=2 Tax=Aspergillus niger TaxID=5061 RepID=A2QXC1_ASPNC|nr:hypothetical protein An11g08380 [Aspergillus niger]CAK46029.1 hypothetical protein An11g08380 [Aspergillus niger]
MPDLSFVILASKGAPGTRSIAILSTASAYEVEDLLRDVQRRLNFQALEELNNENIGMNQLWEVELFDTRRNGATWIICSTTAHNWKYFDLAEIPA